MNRLILLILIAISIIGCATTADLRKLSIGMDKKEVVNVLGEPISTRASTRTYGPVEIWDYNFYNSVLGFPPGRDTYWLFFKENKLSQWGEENDWGNLEREPDYIEKRIFEDQTDKKAEPRFQ